MRKRILFLAFLIEGGLGLAAVGIGECLGRSPLENVHWSFAAVGGGVLATIPLLSLYFFFKKSTLPQTKKIFEILETELRPFFQSSTLADILMVCTLAGLCEELFFRGTLQYLFSLWLNPYLALFCTSVLFGLAHLITRPYATIAGTVGLYLGLLALFTNNLAPAIVAHGTYDLIVILLLLRTPPSRFLTSPGRIDS
ncbi:MAG: CPBP family intramembrane metalloprotease [Deltaproteobacteria bacterium]|nr:CPBP family intramembrane metalloprotease [Deltaproteobacteria bacterium]